MESLGQKGKQQKVEVLGFHWQKASPSHMRPGFHPTTTKSEDKGRKEKEEQGKGGGGRRKGVLKRK